MTPRRPLLALPLLAACEPIVMPSPETAPREARSSAERPLSKDPLRTLSDLGARYLARACGEHGQFVYRINLDPSLRVREAYNVLRHAGAIYALAGYHSRWPDPEIAAAIARALHALEIFVAPVPDHPELSAVWSHDDDEEAKLGGAGLALVALECAPDAGDLSLRRALARFIAFMQKDDGSFHSKLFAGDGPDDSWTSLYYPGEAGLGMAMLHERDRAKPWGEVAKRALLFLASSRRGRRRVPPDHWALLATDRALARSPGLFSAEEREAVVAHSRQIAGSMLASRATHPKGSIRYGCFTRDGRTTPTATRLEGLLAALGHVDDESLAAEIGRAAEAGIAFLSRAMVTLGEHAGAVPRAIERLERPPSESFNRRATEVRIDYVQHTISAFMAQRDRIARR